MEPNVRTILSTLAATVTGIVILPIAQILMASVLSLELFLSPLPYGIIFLLLGIAIGAVSGFIDPERKISYVLSVVFVILFAFYIIGSRPGLRVLIFPMLLGILILVTSSFSTHARIRRGILEKREKK